MGRFLTQKLFLPVSRVQRSRTVSRSILYDHYRSGMKLRRESLDWSFDQKLEWVLNNLRRAVRKAAAETSFYKTTFERVGFDANSNFTLDDFGRLPALTREDVHSAGTDLISTAIPKRFLVQDSTGGSTGAPTRIWTGPEERGWSESGIEFALQSIGVPAGSRIAYFWGHHLDPQLKPTQREKIRSWALNYRFFDSFRLSKQTFQAYHEQLERYAPDCIVAYSSALGQFAEYLRANGIRPINYPRVCFVTGAEKLYPHHRAEIEEVFGRDKPVHERYGGRDFGPVAIQPDPKHSLRYSIDWTWAIVERETPDICSPILVTKLHADAMPLIRYRVGDIGRFAPEAKPGWPAFELDEVIGRELDGIQKPDGSWLHGSQFPHLLKDFPVREFMLVQAEDLSIEMAIVPDTGFGEADRRKIFETISANTGNLPFEIRFTDAIDRGPANKWRPVVSKARF